MWKNLNMREHADTTAAKVFEGMGIYSPTLGIIGAVLGLMAVLQNLADPSKLGHGIAAAFTATVYGIGLANLFFLPVAAKLKVIIARQTQFREMVVDGMLCIAQGELLGTTSPGTECGAATTAIASTSRIAEVPQVAVR